MDIDKYASLSEFREANRLAGTTFCWAVSNTMTNYSVSFAQACTLLELAGCLIWAKNVPIINLARADFWVPKEKGQDKKGNKK